MTSRFASLTEQDIAKNWWRPGITKDKNVDEGGKRAISWLRIELWAADLYIFTRWEIIDHLHSLTWPFFFVPCKIKQTNFGFCDIQNNQGRVSGYKPKLEVEIGVISRSRPWLFWISPKPHAIIVYKKAKQRHPRHQAATPQAGSKLWNLLDDSLICK